MEGKLATQGDEQKKKAKQAIVIGTLDGSNLSGHVNRGFSRF